MATRIGNHLKKFDFEWKDGWSGSTLDLPLFQINIIQQPDKTYRIHVGAYVHPKHMVRLQDAKKRSLLLYREINNFVELKLDELILDLSSDHDRAESEINDWKLTFFNLDND